MPEVYTNKKRSQISFLNDLSHNYILKLNAEAIKSTNSATLFPKTVFTCYHIYIFWLNTFSVKINFLIFSLYII